MKDSKTLKEYANGYVVAQFDTLGNPIGIVGSANTNYDAKRLITDVNTQKVLNVTSPLSKDVIKKLNTICNTEYGEWNTVYSNQIRYIHKPSLYAVTVTVFNLFRKVGFDLKFEVVMGALCKRDMPELVNSIYYEGVSCTNVSKVAFDAMMHNFTNYFIVKA